jgi:putative membrane-bound dehydrogenase-like protein
VYRYLLILLTVLPVSSTCTAAEPTSWLAGFSRVDVTPSEPVRMAGYGSRDHASEGIDTPLHVRSFALKSADADPWVLISVDSIGLPGSMTRELSQKLATAHGLPRANVVFCSTHTHAGPDLISELSNIFATALTADEIAAGTRYKQQLQDGILKAVALSLEKLAPANLAYEVGQASFAANRRVLKDGRWTGFGVQLDGPVDHTVPVLRVTDANGKVRGVIFNYACHCTTLGGEHYNINGDWAGYAAANLEAKYADAVALCTIGCGADANPEPRGTLDATKLHGRTLANEVARIVDGPMKTVDAPLVARFDYAGLAFDLPTQEELQSRLQDSGNPQAKRHAEMLLSVLRRDHRLPATYPVPIQSWQFGDQLTMIFLGGEVVVDYALRLKQSLADPKLWVTAYANDVLGYIASERMRSEGGYEYDRSGVYYGLPGPWAAGTEDLLVRRVTELLKSRGRSQPLATDDALKSFQLTEGYQIELVAAEPLVQDPINIAFDIQGRMWVVEMGDYPEGENGGRIKVLTDANGDGVYDQATEFLGDLPFPTGVLPWRDGVLISSAPDVLFARDTDNDGNADEVQKLYTGFRLANPQHRINGFSYGLDHSLHLGSGDNLGELQSEKTGEVINASGHDVQIWPDIGRIAATSGRTQYVRSRNNWGEWFGNDNSQPMYHFPIDDAYLQRNEHVAFPGSSQQLFDPPVAPPVFPLTAATERFNDLFAANRFTSACSAIVTRTPTYSISHLDEALICEPVHNLVHRALLEPNGATYRAVRAPLESASEFLASTDPWFRPVRAMIGPDDGLYIVDMYRETIEHPEWIPDAWQAQLDLRAGSDRGRIYRITSTQSRAKPMRRFDQLSIAYLVQLLRSPNGALRDLAQQWIIERDDVAATPLLVKLASDASNPHARVHAISILNVQEKLDSDILSAVLSDSHFGVLMVAIQIAESRLQAEPDLLERLAATAQHQDQRVVLQTALALGETTHAAAGKILATIARTNTDPWVSHAIASSAKQHAVTVLKSLLQQPDQTDSDLLIKMLATAQASGVDVATEFGDTFRNPTSDFMTQLRLAASFTTALRSRQESNLGKLLQPLYARAMNLAGDDGQDENQRCEALQLIGLGIQSPELESAFLLDLVSPQSPQVVQQQAIDRLSGFSNPETCDALIARWSSMSKSVRDHCVAKMLEREPWTEKLLSALESKAIAVNDLSAAVRSQLAHTGSRSMQVRAARVTRTGGSIEKEALVRSYLTEMNSDRDPTLGATLFKQHCAVCHVANEQGQAVGASLDNLTDRSDEALIVAILDPNRAVDPKYQSYVIQTVDGRTLVGAIEEEAGQSITLAHADGKRSTIRRQEIEHMKNSGVSLMPEGLHEILKPAAMQNVLAYMQQQKHN